MGNWSAESNLSLSNAGSNVGAIQRAYNILTGASEYDNVPCQKIWRAKILHDTALGTSSTTEIFNSTGVTITPRWNDTGSIEITGSGVFVATSYMRAQLGYPHSGSEAQQAHIRRSGSDDYGLIQVYDNSGSLADVFNDLYVEVVNQA